MFHNYITNKTSLFLISLGWSVFLEFCLCRNGVTNFVDIFGIFNGIQMAFEIETTDRHIVDNCRKAHAVGIPLCIIVPTSKLYQAAVKKTDRIKLRPAGYPIRIFKLSQLQQELMDYLSLIITANRDRDRVINK